MSKQLRKFNTFLFFKLPAAWWTGVRLRHLTAEDAESTVTFGWRNQNPFKSMFWAVQGMAAELATGALVMQAIRQSGKSVSMLVLHNKAGFTKKARGRITFRCEDGAAVQRALQETITTQEGRTVWMTSIGRDASGEIVSKFEFEWTLKAK